MKIANFLKKAVNTSGKISPSAFLKEHRIFLSNFPKVLPVLVALDNGQLLPTPALNQVVTLMALERDPEIREETVDSETGEVLLGKSPAAKEKAEKKKIKRVYTLFVSLDKGIEAVILYSDIYQDAEGQAQRYLFNHGNADYVDIIGQGVTTRINREQAMKAIINGKLGGKIATKSSGGKNGSFLVGKAKESKATFSGA